MSNKFLLKITCPSQIAVSAGITKFCSTPPMIFRSETISSPYLKLIWEVSSTGATPINLLFGSINPPCGTPKNPRRQVGTSKACNGKPKSPPAAPPRPINGTTRAPARFRNCNSRRNQGTHGKTMGKHKINMMSGKQDEHDLKPTSILTTGEVGRINLKFNGEKKHPWAWVWMGISSCWYSGAMLEITWKLEDIGGHPKTWRLYQPKNGDVDIEYRVS